MKEIVEDTFLNWQVSLDKAQQDRVFFDSYNMSLQTVFVERLDGFDRLALRHLERELQEAVDPLILVSSITKE